MYLLGMDWEWCGWWGWEAHVRRWLILLTDQLTNKDFFCVFAVSKNKQRAEEIKTILEDRRHGKDSGSAMAREIRGKLNDTREKFKELVVCPCLCSCFLFLLRVCAWPGCIIIFVVFFYSESNVVLILGMFSCTFSETKASTSCSAGCCE